MADYERKRKYLRNVPAEIVRLIFKHTTQICTLPPSTHLQRQFKSPNPFLDLHCQNEADSTDQIFAKVPAIDGGEASAHIFVSQDLKIADVYTSKDNSICLCLNNCVDPKLGDGTKSPIMMACFAHNDISMLLNFYF